MRRFVIPILLLLFFTIGINAQNIVKGIIVDSDSEKPLEGVSLSIKGSRSLTLLYAISASYCFSKKERILINASSVIFC